MQFSEYWLRQFVNPSLSTDELGHAMTMAGLEVEKTEPVAHAFNHVVIGEIVATDKHPDADRLKVCKVKVDSNESLQIVCGAPNARLGLKVACAKMGAVLPGFAIKQAKLRGVESFGMLCSAEELGISTDAAGIIELPSDAPVGKSLRDYLVLDDQLYTLKLTPNRADCLSILGVARDVAAITGATLTPPVIATLVTDGTKKLTVSVSEPEACPAYFGRLVKGVNAKADTPMWMQRALGRSGVNSISAIVDITNYVLLELGQPMHAFDSAKLHGAINVRFAQMGETIKLLDGNDVKLANDDLVIADEDGAIALAGVMGGEPTSVTETTTSIFLESAFFTPNVMAGKARRLGLSTDSSYRFERGVDYGNTKNVLDRAAALVLEICGGQVGEVTSVVGNLPVRNTVTLRHARLLSVLGLEISKQDTGKLLTQLGFNFEETSAGFSVQAPSYRFDIAREEDLIEEVARLHGYDRIAAVAPTASLKILPTSESTLNAVWLKDVMQARGYQEIVTYSFVEESWETGLLKNNSPIKLKNPIASNMSVMRSSLFGGLLDALVYNLNRKQGRAMLFELGTTFHRNQTGYKEQNNIAGLCYGSALPEQWGDEDRDIDFYDAKATVDSLTRHQVQYKQEEHPALHPGQTARIYMQDKPIGWLGKLHPKWQQKYDLPKSTMLFELETTPLLEGELPKYNEVSKFLAVRRDISILVDHDIEAQSIIDAAYKANIPLLQEIRLFDIYQGKGVPENKKSLAFLILMQDTNKTLIDTEAESATADLLKLLENKFNARLRN